METESETTRRFTTQLPRNLIANFAHFLINVAIGILLVPYFISTLGVVAYGLIPLASSVTGYVAIVVQSLNTTVSRYLTIDLQNSDYTAANRTFNTAFFSLSLIITLFIPIVITISYFVPVIFNVPKGQETGAIILFFCVCIAFFIRALFGTFTVQLFAYNRIDLMNLVNVLNLLVQVGLIVFFFWLESPNLVFVGIAYLGGAIVASAVAILLAKNVCPHLHLSFNSFDRTRVKDLGEMGGWVFINQIGTLLFLQIDLIVVNILFGARSAGEYAIVLLAGNLLRSISGMLSGVLTPMILTFYAHERTVIMIKVIKSAVKLMGLAMALPIGLICGFAPQLLMVWVGVEYTFLSALMVLMTVHLIINLAILPLFSINIAYNRVRVPGIITLIMGIGNFALAFILASFTGWGYYGVAAAGAIVLTLKNAVFTPWYAAKVIGVKTHTFTKQIFPGVVACLFLIIFARILGTFIMLNTVISLFITCGILSILYSIIMWRFGLSNGEQKLFGSYLPEKIRELIL